jgi:diguanylate cyclase (GGDEF)-like protein
MIDLAKVMARDVVTSSPTATVLSVVELLQEHGIGCVVVVDDQQLPMGIVTERDIVMTLLQHREETLQLPVSRIMHTPVHTMPPTESIQAVAAAMAAHRVRRIPVVEDGALVGIISNRDLTSALARSNSLLRRQTAKLAWKASRDSLTGLYNRGHLMEQLRAHLDLSWQLGTPMSLLLIDVDDFKRINDTHGHLCGDAVLTGLARILEDRSRIVNTVARLGGDEFAILGPISRRKSAVYLAERIRGHVEEHCFEYSDTRVRLTVSIGVAVWNTMVTLAEDMIKVADQALYAAKHAGKNQVVIGS